MAGDPVTIAKAIVDPSLPRLEKSQQFMLALRDVLQVIAVSFPTVMNSFRRYELVLYTCLNLGEIQELS